MILLILILIFQPSNINVFAANSQSYYARIMFDYVLLYKSPVEDNSIENTYFQLPKTYFVELVDEQGEFYKARYLSTYGYVKKDSVQAVLGIPTNPFLNNISFRVYAPMSEQLFSFPTSSSNLITNINHLSKNIQYIGSINGEQLIEGRTNVWFYCKYISDKEYFGYVYSDFCDEMMQITNNMEQFEYTSNPSFNSKIESISALPKDSNYIGIVVGILSIPALIFVFMIIKGSKIVTQEKNIRKEIIDY